MAKTGLKSSGCGKVMLLKREEVLNIKTAVICLLNGIATLVEGRPPSSYHHVYKQVLSEKTFEALTKRYFRWVPSTTPPPPLAPSFSNSKERSKSAKDPSVAEVNQTNQEHDRSESYRRSLSQRSFSNLPDTRRIRDEEQASVFLSRLTTSMEACRRTLVVVLRRRSERERTLARKVDGLNAGLKREEDQAKLMEMKIENLERHLRHQSDEAAALRQQLNDERNKRERLERCNVNVAWEKKLGECREESERKEKNHLRDFIHVEKTFDERMNVLKRQVKDLEIRLGQEKMRQNKWSSSSELYGKMDVAQRRLFVKEQELYESLKEGELKVKMFAGLIQGLYYDYEKVWRHGEKLRRGLNPSKDELRFRAILQYLNQSMKANSINDLMSKLPPYYSHQHQNPEEEAVPEIVLPRPKVNSLATQHLKNGEEKKDSKHAKERYENPKLVNIETGRADLVKIMKEFSFLTFKQIDSLWKQFKKFDKNDDFALDSFELLEAIRETEMLDLVRQKDVDEAMEEIDLDGSGSVDFYEFLKIGEMILKKQGISYIFKHQLLNRRDATGRRFCGIQ